MSEKSVSPDLYTEEYFLSACEGYDEFLASEGEQLSRRLQASFEIAAIESGMKILDVGCGRGEIMRRCAELGADAFGFDYAPVAVRMTRQIIQQLENPNAVVAAAQADAKYIPFPSNTFDRVLMFDVVEHLFPWELHQALLEIRRVLKPGGRLIIHTAPNIWYDRYAYPMVRRVRILWGAGAESYPSDPRQFLVEHNKDVHVNEQSILSMRRTLAAAGFSGKVWLDSPPQNRQENRLLAGLRYVLFNVPPMRWFFEREIFAVARVRADER